jgi:hypothetical protein
MRTDKAIRTLGGRAAIERMSQTDMLMERGIGQTTIDKIKEQFKADDQRERAKWIGYLDRYRAALEANGFVVSGRVTDGPIKVFALSEIRLAEILG